MTPFETIKQEIQSLYPDCKFTDAELFQMATDVINFGALLCEANMQTNLIKHIDKTEK